MGRKKFEPKTSLFSGLKDETKYAVLAIAFFILTAFFALASLDYAGAVGGIAYSLIYKAFGVGFFLLPVVCLLLGVAFLRSQRPQIIAHRLIGGGIFFFSALGLIAILAYDNAGGFIGALVATPLLKLFDFYISILALMALIIIAVFVLFDTHLTFERKFFGKMFGRRNESETPTDDDLEPSELIVASDEKAIKLEPEKSETEKPLPIKNGNDISDTNYYERAPLQNDFSDKTYIPPPLQLLERDSGRPSVGDIKGRANTIKRTLEKFGIMVEMDEVSIGPSITRYALKPAEGVKLSRILALQDNLSLALAAHPLRIEAPIPGKSLVGIEIPNTVKSTVGLASLVGSKEFAESPYPLLVSLGRSISGAAHFANISKAPHILIAGATGSGKSVVIHTFITSLLYRNGPADLRFIMIDPKRVELTLYNKIPHLFTPVITEAKKAIATLKWLTGEMERRYKILESFQVRDISSYHKNVADKPERLPYFMVIIDELADIMSAYPRELEAVIVRLAQMSRAVGIHLVLSTQRPSVEVITGLIKANIPSRLALQVASQIDSRTILDMGGAEKLLGAGDMLYLSGDMSKPLRLQSAFVTEEEVKKVVKFVADQYNGVVVDELALMVEPNQQFETLDEGALEQFENSGDDDDRYDEALEIVLTDKKASATYLQRKMSIGYGRAAKLLDMMEERNVIGPANGAKAREIYTLTKEEEAKQF
ncbi:MAG: DNA translocase FtsK 4TM domain-containing protein [Patescibacteria group bacterium]